MLYLCRVQAAGHHMVLIVNDVSAARPGLDLVAAAAAAGSQADE
jgi:hypothetical protein